LAPSAANGKNSRYERLRRLKALQRADSGPGANWAADLASAAARPSSIYAGQDLLGVRIPVLSVSAAALAAAGALVSLVLGFLILGEDLAGFVPSRWLALFAASSAATFALLIAAVVSGRRALGLRGLRSAADSPFFWETVLSTAAAVAFGTAGGLSRSFPAYLFLASILAVYVTLARWTWWTWRGLR
jgi:hypothetical protein